MQNFQAMACALKCLDTRALIHMRLALWFDSIIHNFTYAMSRAQSHAVISY